MQAVRGVNAWDGEGAVGGKWNVYGVELFTTWRVRLARFAVDH